jgi:hypothetical protein
MPNKSLTTSRGNANGSMVRATAWLATCRDREQPTGGCVWDNRSATRPLGYLPARPASFENDFPEVFPN